MATLVSTLAFTGDDLGVSPPGELQGPVGISIDETGDNLFISYGRFEFSGMDVFGVIGVYRVALDINGDVDMLSPNTGVMAEHQFADAFAVAAPQTCCAVVAGTVYVGVIMGSELPFAGNPNQWLFSCPVAAPGAGTLTVEASDPTECPVQMDRGTDGLIYALTASGYGALYTPGIYSMTHPYAGSMLLNVFNYSTFTGQAYMQCGPREAGGRIIAGADDQINSWDNTGGDPQVQGVTLFDQLAPNMPTAVLAGDGVRLWVQSQEAVPGVNENLLINNLGVVETGSAFDNGWGIPQWITGSNSDDGSVVYVVDWDVSLTGGFFVYRLTDDVSSSAIFSYSTIITCVRNCGDDTSCVGNYDVDLLVHADSPSFDLRINAEDFGTVVPNQEILYSSNGNGCIETSYTIYVDEVENAVVPVDLTTCCTAAVTITSACLDNDDGGGGPPT